MQGVVNDASPVYDGDFAKKDWGLHDVWRLGVLLSHRLWIHWTCRFFLGMGVLGDLVCCAYSPFAHGSHLYDYRTPLWTDFGQSMVNSRRRRY